MIDAQSSKITPLGFNCVETAKEKIAEERLFEIHEAIKTIIRTYSPMVMAVEDLFFATNAKTAIGVGQSRGVILLTAFECHIPVVSYSPLAVKRTITGDGKADKKQVSRMVTLTLKLKETPKLDDTTDALAIAMTHAYSYKIKQLQ